MEHPAPPSALTPAAAVADPAVPALERVARLAATAFGVPFATVVRFGYGGDGVAPDPVSHGSLGSAVAPDLRLACAGLPADAALVVVEDAAKDARFFLPPNARFFACARAEAPDGRALGAVCLLDDMPHVLDPAMAEGLADLAVLTALALDAHTQADAAAQAEARFQALSETVFDALLITEAGVVLDANDRAAALFGHDGPDPLIGGALADLVPDYPAGEAAFGIPHAAVILRADGTECAVEVNAMEFPHQGRVLRLTAVRAVA